MIIKASAALRQEQLLQLRFRVLQAEQERIDGAQTLCIAEARKRLRERLDEREH